MKAWLLDAGSPRSTLPKVSEKYPQRSLTCGSHSMLDVESLNRKVSQIVFATQQAQIVGSLKLQ